MANREYFLEKSKHFCMIPWVHMHLWPNGNAFPCCLADSSMPLGNYNEAADLKAIWNGPAMKRLRKNMLADKASPECSRCYLFESQTQIDTLRTTANKNWQHHWPSVEQTREDGTADEIKMAYLDIRFSNLCNFKCRTCGPQLSSAWFDDQVKLYGHPGHEKVLRPHDTEKFWQELEPLLLGVEQVYFAGGEPLLAEEHYRVLDFWLAHGKTNVDIIYTTNFSTLKFRDKNILDYWKKFTKVHVAASLDAAEARAEYLRKGTDWSRIVENRKRLQEECPHVTFEITPTISAYNVWHFPDFHQQWIDQGLLHPHELRLNLLTNPPWMSIQILPEDFKQAIEAKYRASLAKLLNLCEAQGLPTHPVRSGYESVLSYLRAEDTQPQQRKFLSTNFKVDKVREEDFYSTFPELGFLKQTENFIFQKYVE